MERLKFHERIPQLRQSPQIQSPQNAKNHWIRFEEIANEYMAILPGSVWTTYTALFTFRNRKTNQCFPRYQTIADKRGVHRRTIIRHVAILVKVWPHRKRTPLL